MSLNPEGEGQIQRFFNHKMHRVLSEDYRHVEFDQQYLIFIGTASKQGFEKISQDGPNDFGEESRDLIICIKQQEGVQNYRIIYFIMKGKNIWNVYSHLSPQQWQIKQSTTNLKLINNYSDEQFTLVRISPFCDSMLQSLHNRSFYPIPSTPKIIMPTYQIDPNKIEAFVQTQTKEITQLFKKMPCDILILEKLKAVIQTVEMLTKKYGFFRITPHMLKVTKREAVLVWMNEKVEFQVRKYPIVKETKADSINIMITDLLTIFLSGCEEGVLCRAKERLQNKKMTSFEYCIIEIDKYISEQIQKAKNKKNSHKQNIPHFLKNKSPNKNMSMNDMVKSKKCLTPKSPQKKGEKKNLSILPKIKSQDYLLIKKSVPPPRYPPVQQQQANSKSFSHKNTKIMKMIQSVENLQSVQKIQNEPLTVSQNFNSFLEVNRRKTDEKKESPYKSMDQISVTKKSTQCMDQESTKCDKKNFRDSSNSLATTNFYHSITSSGRTKLLEEEASFHQKKVTNSFGEAKSPKSKMRPENRFKVKASKIIQEYNCEDGTQNSPQSNENSEIINNKSEWRLYESEIEKDFYDLLYHDASKDQHVEEMKVSDHFKLQEEFSKVLF